MKPSDSKHITMTYPLGFVTGDAVLVGGKLYRVHKVDSLTSITIRNARWYDAAWFRIKQLWHRLAR